MAASVSFKPRIAILVHSLNEGGSQKRVVSLANGFAARGHAVDLLAMSGAGAAGRLVAPFDAWLEDGWGYWLVCAEHRRQVPKIKRLREWLLAEVKRDLDSLAPSMPAARR